MLDFEARIQRLRPVGDEDVEEEWRLDGSLEQPLRSLVRLCQLPVDSGFGSDVVEHVSKVV